MLTEHEVLDGLAAAGLPTSRTRFENWRERGLIVPCGTREGLGQGKGRRAHLYPDGTAEQAIEIARLREQNLDLDEIGWRLWLVGYEVGRRYWFDVFDVSAKEFDEAATLLRQSLDADEGDANSIEKIAEQAYRVETSNQLFKHIRKSLGPDRLATMILHLASMVTGQFVSASTRRDPDDKERQADLRTMDLALGLAHARSDTVNGGKPIISGKLVDRGDYSPTLRATFEPLAETKLSEFLRAVDPERLRKVAQSWIELTKSIAAASPELDRAFAKDAFGLGRAAMLARNNRNRQAGMALLWTLIQERSREQFHDLSEMARLFSAAATVAKSLPSADSVSGNVRRPEFRRTAPRRPVK